MKMDEMEGGAKPVPLPRRTNNNNPSALCPSDRGYSNSPEAINVGDVNCNPPTPPPRISSPSAPQITSSGGSNKPVPFPRKLIQRLTTTNTTTTTTNAVEKDEKSSDSFEVQLPPCKTTEEIKEEEEEDELNYENIPGPPSVPKDAKRGTINLFKRANQLQDPFDMFDSEFEGHVAQLREPQAQIGDRQEELSDMANARFSTVSWLSSSTTNTDDSDHYMEPPPARPVSSQLAANLSQKRRELPNRVTTTRNSSLHSFQEEESTDFVRKLPLGKVLSCPVSSTPLEEEMYEPICSFSSTDSSSDGSINKNNINLTSIATNPASQIIPPNSNFSHAKRTTVPNVDKFIDSVDKFSTTKTKTQPSSSSLTNTPKQKKDPNGTKRFDATAFDISDLFPKKNSKEKSFGLDPDMKRRSLASSTETTDSFGSFRNGNVELRRSSSNRSSSSASLKKFHDYDDVAIEDGSVVLLDNLNFVETLSEKTGDSTNNNSSSSLTSRNSVIAEFDPLLTLTPFDPKNSLKLRSKSVGAPPPPVPNTNNIPTFKTPPPPEPIRILNDLSKSPPLNLNDEEQHRYEFIDTDPEDGDRTSNVDNNSRDSSFEDESTGSLQGTMGKSVPLRMDSSQDNPAYFSNAAFVTSRWSDENPTGSVSQDEYEPVAPTPGARSPVIRGSSMSSSGGSSQSPKLPPKPERLASSLSVSPGSPKSQLSPKLPASPPSDSEDAADGKRSSDGGSASLVNHSSFFRRFSTKFKLNSIKEEKDAEKNQKEGRKCSKCELDHVENGRCKFTPVCRPSVLYSSNVYTKAGIGRKDFIKKRVVLAKGKLSFYNDKSDVISELPLEKVVVMFKRDDYRVNPNLPNLKYFELGLISWKSASMVLAAGTEGERSTWMHKYIEAHTAILPQTVITNFDRGGWCFIKETVTSRWKPCWLILKERSLFYAYEKSEEYYEMDLRKARSIVLSQKEEEHKCPFVDNSEVLTIDLICKILYVQTESGKVTQGWERAIQAKANLNGPTFAEMQLTLDNVPVIVDKCIDFLYAHGTLAEGIYRQSGSNTRITQLLAEFQKDAWGVQISHKEFSAHDVAGTLKRFFRTLPEPLVTSATYDQWIKAASMMRMQAKIEEYTRLLETLPQINYNIMKKLICHLYAVHELNDKNLMPVINLAPIWGPTLMNVDKGEVAQSYETACAECEVVKFLIENYYILFRVDSQEIAREKKMQDALENFHLGCVRRKHSGDMKIWIYLWEKDETSAINVTLTPGSTAHAIVHELCSKSQIRNVENVSLHEVICGKALERPLHPSEKVIESVLRWSIWDIEERKNNFLILKKNAIYPPLVHYAKDVRVVGGDLKYADSRSKTFRKYAFHFSRPTLKYSKDPKSTTEIGSWKIEDIVWYVGCEPKRVPPTKWTFTFVKRNYPFKRCRDEPYFGNVICCSSEEEMHKWLGAMVVGEHPEGLYPSVIV